MLKRDTSAQLNLEHLMRILPHLHRPGLAAALLAATLVFAAEEPPVLPLPKPRMEGGKLLMQALKERQSIRAFKPDALPLPVLSDLLWAAYGINRPANDHRTVPSTMNFQEMDLYVARTDGVYLYEAKPHQLRRVSSADLRALTTGQADLKVAPLAQIGRASCRERV